MHEKALPGRNGCVRKGLYGVMFLIFLLTGNFGHSQTGTTCANPIVVSALPYTTTDDTADYADNYDPSTDSGPECSGSNGNNYHGGNDVIYSFTPSEDTSINISMPDVVAWTGMFVYTDCNDIGVDYAACSVGSGAGDREINHFLVEGGQTYYILLSTYPDPQTFEYTLNITENTCIIHSVDFTVEPDCDNGEQFFITAEVTSMGSADSITITDNQDSEPQEVTALGTVTFGPYESLTEVVLTAVNDGDDSCELVSDELTMIGCPTANDECSGAIALTVNTTGDCTTGTQGTTMGATASSQPAECNGTADDDVWYTFEALGTSHTISIFDIESVYGDSEDMYVEVLSGTCGDVESVACEDDEFVTVIGLTAGENYFVRVYSYGDEDRMDFSICIGVPPSAPANDDCEGAVALTVNPDLSCGDITSGTTLGATGSMESDPCNGDPDDDVWFTFEAEADEHLITLSNITVVSGDEDDDDLYFQVLSGECGDEMESIECSDPESGMVTGLTAGETYYVRVYSYYDDARQSFDICIGTQGGAPANDDCAGAVALTVNDDLECTTTTQGTTAAATESMEADPCSGDPDDDVWFSFEATSASHQITISNISTVIGDESEDMYFQVLSGECGEEMESIKCSDPESGFVNGLTSGETYYVRVYSYYDDSRMNFSICVGTPPAAPENDDCEDAIALTVNTDLECGDVTEATTLGATESMEADPCDGDPDDDVWFSFEATSVTHQITISDISTVAGEDSEDMYFQVLSGECGGGMASIKCSDPEEGLVSGLTAGETYYVRVYSYYDESMMDFSICVGTPPAPPANDECADAVALTVGDDFESAAVATTNAYATHDNDDIVPDCDSSEFEEEGNDIWFTVTVPASGSIILETRGNGDENIDDTGLAAYSGSCGSITELDCNSDDGEDNFSLLELSGLTPGETLLVRVWGYQGEYGAFEIAAYDTCNAVAPDGDEEQTLAPGDTLADLDVDGDELTWYSDEELTTEVPATTVAVDGTTYYVTQVVDGCISPALDITVAIVDPCAGILAPEADEEQTLNLGQTLADLDVEGEDLTWYSDEELTSEIPATTAAVDGTTYYVTQTVGECTSSATDITVEVVDPCAGILAPEAEAAQTLDLGETLADLEVTGENLTWYSDAELTTEIPDTTVAVNGTVYYVTQTVGECTSDATDINVTVVDPCEGTLAPAGDEEQEFNTGETLADLDVTGENLTWYSDLELTTEIPATTVLVDGTTYYVTQTVGECVSTALSVTVNEILGTGGLDKASFRYYPNPVANVLTLSYAEAITNVTVYNMLGQPVITATLNATEGTVDVSHLASGNYLVKVQAGDAATTIKIVKN